MRRVLSFIAALLLLALASGTGYGHAEPRATTHAAGGSATVVDAANTRGTSDATADLDTADPDQGSDVGTPAPVATASTIALRTLATRAALPSGADEVAPNTGDRSAIARRAPPHA